MISQGDRKHTNAFAITTRTSTKCTHFLGGRISKRKPVLEYVSGYLDFENLGVEALYPAAKHLFSRLNVLHFDFSRAVKPCAITFQLCERVYLPVDP